MPVIINQTVQQGVPAVASLTFATTGIFRVFVRLSVVDLNNIRLLGILRFARRSSASEPAQFYLVERAEVRAQRDSFLFGDNVSYTVGDAVQFVPLYDFSTCIISTN